ncbi:MAG: effector binding domain-containing protein [Lachnospiraceae bacterium]|nr:effector binding domain-containing protein [Lachnospiraceae bacterium]
MNDMTIGEVSSAFQISTRMLRYYEKIGLIKSTRKEGYAYRIYSADMVRTIQQIIILRKLQIPLKQIQTMMDGNKEETIRILETRIHEMNETVTSVQTIRKALEKLLELLCEDDSDKNYMDIVQEDAIVELTEFLPLRKHHVKGEHQMSNASVTKEIIEKDHCVRIVLLPPCTVASYQFVGDDPEEKVGEVMDTFIRSSKLYEIKPDSRLFGFNNPEPQPGSDFHGYEDWVTIPDDMEVPKPLVKKHFDGGLYAAYTINFPDFYEWNFLKEWVHKNEKYQEDHRDYLEEHLNWVYSSHMNWPENGIDGKIDLLLPIKAR